MLALVLLVSLGQADERFDALIAAGEKAKAKQIAMLTEPRRKKQHL